MPLAGERRVYTPESGATMPESLFVEWGISRVPGVSGSHSACCPVPQRASAFSGTRRVARKASSRTSRRSSATRQRSSKQNSSVIASASGFAGWKKHDPGPTPRQRAESTQEKEESTGTHAVRRDGSPISTHHVGSQAHSVGRWTGVADSRLETTGAGQN